MVDIPRDINLDKTNDYVIRVKGDEMQIKSNKSLLEKARNAFCRFVYSGEWSYKTSKINDVINNKIWNAEDKKLDNFQQNEVQQCQSLQKWISVHAASDKKSKLITRYHDPLIQKAYIAANILQSQADLNANIQQENAPTSPQALYKLGLKHEKGAADTKKILIRLSPFIDKQLT